MNILRKILFPFAILYGLITAIRNFFYDIRVLKSYAFDVPIIAVGNLSVGGTGKTPQIEYLIRLLSPHYKIATLSRGYKRKSKGFVLANSTVNAEILGDEPFQLFKKFPQIQVAVDANRKNGIEQLLLQGEKPNVILLDDAFQHRKVTAGFYILLTAYDDLYYQDYMLPTGNLREYKCNSKRANVIIITKCPKDLSKSEQEKIKQKINLKTPIFFTYIDYDNKVYSETRSKDISEIITADKLLLAGIAKPEPFFVHLQNQNDDKLVYPDHHYFTENDIIEIQKLANNKPIITTEKDFVRLKKQHHWNNLFYLPIKSSFIKDSDNFDKLIQDYVGKSSRNR
jgi:tetraacyldisaccharide 4'-kinase